MVQSKVRLLTPATNSAHVISASSAGDAMNPRPSLIAALAASEDEVRTFFGSFSEEQFGQRMGSAWSPAEHLQHLNITVSAVARGFSIPFWLLLLRYGLAR